MKKRVYLAIFALTFGLCAGCGNKEADSDISGTEDTVFQTEEPLELSGTGNIDLSEENKDSGGKNADSSEENNGSGEEDTDIESTDTQEIDFTRDYSEDIKKDVDDVVSASASLQEELENIHTLSEQYEAIAQTAQTQGEMNMSSGWFLKIWDTELNNLWSRFSDSADAQTKEKVLAEQRSWNSMKEEVAQESLGLIFVFALKLKWLPTSGFGSSTFNGEGMALILHKLKYLIMPALVMSLSNLATVMRFARSSMIETLNQDYVRTARAKGLSEKVVIYKHALKNSMIPVITIFGQSIPNLFGGAYITEKVFGWPGMGLLGVDAINNRDYQMLMGLTLFTAILVLLGNLLADIMYSFVDPRIRY